MPMCVNSLYSSANWSLKYDLPRYLNIEFLYLSGESEFRCQNFSQKSNPYISRVTGFWAFGRPSRWFVSVLNIFLIKKQRSKIYDQNRRMGKKTDFGGGNCEIQWTNPNEWMKWMNRFGNWINKWTKWADSEWSESMRRNEIESNITANAMSKSERAQRSGDRIENFPPIMEWATANDIKWSETQCSWI